MVRSTTFSIMSTINSSLFDAKRTIGTINARKTINRTLLGQQVVLTIQGAGTFQSATEQEARTPGQKQYFDKYIHNLKANSAEAMSRPETKAILAEAMKAEAAGDVEKADELFRQYLNTVQVSFNVIAATGRRKFEDGDMVTAVIEEAETKDGHKALVVNDVRYKAPVSVDKVKFDITDLLGEPAQSTGANQTVPQP